MTLILSGVLSNDVSWEAVFYAFGALGCAWFVFWLFLVFESPDRHPWISEVVEADENRVQQWRSKSFVFTG